MRTYIYLPPLRKMSGGLAMLLRLGGFLASAGFELTFLAREKAPWLNPGEGLPAGVEIALWEGEACSPQAGDIWLVPEGWPHALLPGLRAGCRVVVYVQNWAYLLAEWPEYLAPDALPVHYLAVSHPVSWYIKKMTGKIAPVLPAGIDLRLFCPREGDRSNVDFEPGSALRVAWMPRKNKAQARHIREIVDAARALQGKTQLEWIEIHNRSQAEVAVMLQSSDCFLATGFPEGFGLPPLEAMACGCVCVGFSGFGGLEYMRHMPEGGGEAVFPGWVDPEIRADLAGRVGGVAGNGLWVADGDILGAALALEQVLAFREENNPRWQVLIQGGLGSAARYGLDSMEKKAQEYWRAAARQELFGAF